MIARPRRSRSLKALHRPHDQTMGVVAVSDSPPAAAFATILDVAIPSYRPQLATLTRAAPAAGVVTEVKLDGWRAMARIESGRVRLLSKNGNDLSKRAASIMEAARQLAVESAVLDGELAVVLADGRTSFQALQNMRSLPAGAQLTYFVFDLLYLDGRDVAPQPYEARKGLLQALLAASANSAPPIQYVPYFLESPAEVLKHACALGAEGIVCKRLGAPHVDGRSRDWLKVKCERVEQFVIGGFTEASGGASLGALLVGYYDPRGALRFAGSVGTGKGFTREFLTVMCQQLERISRRSSPFERFDPSALRSQWGQRRRAKTRWVQPIVVVDVAFTEWTDEGLLRHPSFRGFRKDLEPRRVLGPAKAAADTPEPRRKAHSKKRH